MTIIMNIQLVIKNRATEEDKKYMYMYISYIKVVTP